MSDFLNVTFLSILQGVAEFLPISSSGHLVLGKTFLGMRETGMRLDVFLHVGTLFAVAIFYFATIRRVLMRREWSYMFKIVVSAVPAGIVGVLFKDRLEALFASPHTVGWCLCFTGLVLTATRFLPKIGRSNALNAKAPVIADISWLQTIAMGLAQAVAILPGVSRSGMTLSAARAAGANAEKAAEFSFLMSAPPIAGAALLDVLKLGEATAATETPWGLTLFGAVLAGITGYFALAALVKILRGRFFWLFGPYCLLAGLVTIFFA